LTISRALALGVAVALAVDAYVHATSSRFYDPAHGGLITEGNPFRAEAVVSGVLVVLLLLRPSGWTLAAALLVATSALAALVLYRYVDVGSIGPIPDLYEPTWHVPGKLPSAYAEGIAVVLSAAAIAQADRNPGLRGAHSWIAAAVRTSGFVGKMPWPTATWNVRLPCATTATLTRSSCPPARWGAWTALSACPSQYSIWDVTRVPPTTDAGRRVQAVGPVHETPEKAPIEATAGTGTTRHEFPSHASAKPFSSLPPAKQNRGLVQSRLYTPPPGVAGIGTLLQWEPFQTSASWAPFGKQPGIPGRLQSGDEPTAMQKVVEAQLTPSRGTNSRG
jgi:hypothetical protein